MIKNKKSFSLPKKSAKESTSGGVADVESIYGGSISRTRFRTDFEEQARQLKEKIAIGPTPVRVERPINKFTLSSSRALTGDIDSLETPINEETRIDLTHAASTVYESIKRPIFKRRKKSMAPVSDERESTDKQPKEAVACESDPYNHRESVWLRNKDSDGISSAMKQGNIAKARGKYLLSKLPQFATEGTQSSYNTDVIIPRSTDIGTPLDKDTSAKESTPAIEGRGSDKLPKELWESLVASDTESHRSNSSLEKLSSTVAQIDTEIGDDLGGSVSYSSQQPIKGQITKLSKANAESAKEVLEGLGLEVRQVAAKESISLLFSAKESILSKSWYALVASGPDKTKLEQVTISSDAADKDQVKAFLESKFGKDTVYSVSTSPIQ